ncbi:MAG: S1C family serine protease, partial [Pseudonocardia sp.]
MTNGSRDGTSDEQREDPPGLAAPAAARPPETVAETVAEATHPPGVTTYVDPLDGTPLPPPEPHRADDAGGYDPPTIEHPHPWAGGWAGQPVPGPPPPVVPGAPWAQPAPVPPPPRGGGLGRTLVIGLVAGLLGGLLGGVVGHSLADGGGSIGVLGSGLPEIDDAAPLGPVEAVAQRVLPSVVQLRVRSGESGGEGSGMVLSADGLVLTNNHVVDEAANGATLTALFQDGTTAAADIVGRDPTSDIAVVRVRGVTGLTPIELGNSDGVRVGQQVVAIGSPLGLGGSVTTGIISAVDRAVNVGPQNGATDSTVLNALQTDAAINPGNSGGPLVDMQGRVIGVNSAIATTGGAQGGSIGVGFSIPINQAHRIATELESTGVATRAVLGVNVGVGSDDTNGAVIGQVTPG